MSKRNGRHRSNGTGQTTTSTPPNSSNPVEEIRRVNRGNDLQLEQRYKRLNQRFQVASLLVAVLAIGLTCWNVALQLSQGAFERNQKVTEMAVDLGNYWDRLDDEIRYRLTRFLRTLKDLETSPAEQHQFLVDFLDDQMLLHADWIKANKALSGLVDPAYSPSGLATSPSVELSKYRSDIVKVLNIMELIAIVRQHTTDAEALRVLNNAYASSIKMRYRQLLPFITAYREKYEDDRKVPAWQPLDALGTERDN